MSERFQRGDVVWAPDPFRSGTNPRLWLVLATESLPYAGEEYICAALTTSDLPANIQIGENWMAGNNPQKRSYCSPWVLATIKHRAISNPQGYVTEVFADQIAEMAGEYLQAG